MGESVTSGRRYRRAAARLARDLRLLPGTAAPVRSVAGFERAGARLLGTRIGGGEPQRRAPLTVQTADDEFELAASGPWRSGSGCVAVLKSGRLVTSEGLVVTADGLLVEESLWDADHRARSELWRHRLPPAVRVDGTHASIISLWCENYFHWLLDALPRIALLEEAGESQHRLVVPEQLRSFQLESLRALGYDAGRLTRFAGGQLAPDVLVWPSPAAHVGYPTRRNVEWLRRRLVRLPRAGRRRIYVSRSDATTRVVVNEPELMSALQPYGFERVLPHDLSFGDQVALFADAEIVVGPHGAGLSNMVFARDASVCEIVHPGRRNPCFYRLASASRHDYWYVLAEASGANMVVPVADVVETVNGMCAVRARRVAAADA
jgi:capsular polysaccharide biosynthesis protein